MVVETERVHLSALFVVFKSKCVNERGIFILFSLIECVFSIDYVHVCMVVGGD